MEASTREAKGPMELGMAAEVVGVAMEVEATVEVAAVATVVATTGAEMLSLVFIRRNESAEDRNRAYDKRCNRQGV